MLKPPQRKDHSPEDFNSTQNLTTWYSKCPGYNLKLLEVSMMRKIWLILKGKDNQQRCQPPGNPNVETAIITMLQEVKVTLFKKRKDKYSQHRNRNNQTEILEQEPPFPHIWIKNSLGGIYSIMEMTEEIVDLMVEH